MLVQHHLCLLLTVFAKMLVTVFLLAHNRICNKAVNRRITERINHCTGRQKDQSRDSEEYKRVDKVMTRRKDRDLLVKLTDGPIVSRVTLSRASLTVRIFSWAMK